MLPAQASQAEDRYALQNRQLCRFMDFLKAAGILWIFSFHFYGIYLTEGSLKKLFSLGIAKVLLSGRESLISYISGLSQVVFSLGSLGVEWFFIASGFGLQLSYAASKPNWTTFYKKRFLRVVPLYYLFLTVSFLVNILILKSQLFASPAGIKNLLYHIFFIQTFSTAYRAYGLFFFVGILLQLYLLFPLLRGLMKKRGLALVVFGGAIVFPLTLDMVLSSLGVTVNGILVTTYLPYFIFGMLIAAYTKSSPKIIQALFSPAAALAGAALLTVTIYLISYAIEYDTNTRMPLAFASFFLLYGVFLLIRKTRIMKMVKPVAYSAYVFYLLHLIVIKLGLGLVRIERDQYVQWMMAAMAAMGTSLLIAYSIQRGYDLITGATTSTSMLKISQVPQDRR